MKWLLQGAHELSVDVFEFWVAQKVALKFMIKFKEMPLITVVCCGCCCFLKMCRSGVGRALCH